MVIGQTCNYWDRIGLECVRRINVENTATQKLWRFQEFVLHINDCCDRNDTQMICISYWIGRSTNTISTRHSFFCHNILMLAFHWGTPPTTNEQAQRLNVGNDHLILANHTCCECIKWNGGVICIFRISTTSTLAQNDATVAPMTELWFSDRPQSTKWHKTDCWWMIEGGGDDKRCVQKKCNFMRTNMVAEEVGVATDQEEEYYRNHAHYDWCTRRLYHNNKQNENSICARRRKMVEVCCAFKSRRPTVCLANWTGPTTTTTTHCNEWLRTWLITGDSIAIPFCISRSFFAKRLAL